ncbi:uncharacterized protein LOC130731798 [Lotus japonicus]|uniref:uncharacterized protein LOC130731798 n=1 Tax=Lotus japonicus TaxID=34305 RepID=UPI00258AD8C9|nr:uncharacterized protein LOC130731798 [Lotus japonicus]
MTFAQAADENLYEAWERFKNLLRKCPQHNLTQAQQVAKFYDGLQYSSRFGLDAASNGEFDALLPQVGYELIEKMALRPMNSSNDCQARRGVLEVEAYDRLIASNKQLSKQMAEIQNQMKTTKVGGRIAKVECVTCGGQHDSEDCTETRPEEEVKAMGQARNDPFSNTYNPGWRNHPNFSWRQSNNGQGGMYQRQFPNQGIQGQSSRQPQERIEGESGGSKKNLEELVETFINRTENNYKNQEAAIKNLENQFGQLAKLIAERPQGKFPSDTIPNPKQENASVVTTRSGRVMSELKKKTEGGKNEEIVEGEIVVPIKTKEVRDLTPKVSKIPFPKALTKKNIDKKFSKFVEVFIKLHINIPFADALEQMPIYARFMKDILSKRMTLKGVDETVVLTEECSAILQRKMPMKRRDPESFTIPVEVEGKAEA